MSRLSRFVAFVFLVLPCVRPCFGDAYDAQPKLVVILVFDQFRGDYLDRYHAEFKAKNGWNLFLKQGAHFTDCYYDYANLVTAAGHATIGHGRRHRWPRQFPSMNGTNRVQTGRYAR